MLSDTLTLVWAERVHRKVVESKDDIQRPVEFVCQCCHFLDVCLHDEINSIQLFIFNPQVDDLRPLIAYHGLNCGDSEKQRQVS